MTIPADDLVAGQSFEVKARNEYGVESSVLSTQIPVFVDSINALSGLAASPPSWDEGFGTYVTSISWPAYRPFEGSGSALGLLEPGDQPAATVAVSVPGTPTVTLPAADGNVDLSLDNAEAPQFDDAVTQVAVDDLGSRTACLR